MHETASASTNRPSNTPADGQRRVGALRNGLVGGVLAVLLSVLPLSEALGGALAGYLDRGAGRSGTAAGTVAGLVAFLPYLAVGGYLAVAPGVALPGPELAVAREVLVAGATAVALVYVVGLGVSGSLVGGAVHDAR